MPFLQKTARKDKKPVHRRDAEYAEKKFAKDASIDPTNRAPAWQTGFGETLVNPEKAVMPAKAGIQRRYRNIESRWIPAFAGMTDQSGFPQLE